MQTTYSVWRPDVRASLGTPNAFVGFVFVFPVHEAAKASEVAVAVDGVNVLATSGEYVFSKPAYSQLLNTDRVLTRNEIYSSGPPPEIYNDPSLVVQHISICG